jgi:HIRAN domain
MTIAWTDAQGRPVTCIHRFHRILVGLTHKNKAGEDRIALARRLSIGTPLLMVQETNNPVDRNAILIYRADDPSNDLGYLDATGAKQFAKMMERGATFAAEVYWVNNDSPSLPQVYIYVYQLTEPLLKKRPTRKNAPEYKTMRTP